MSQSARILIVDDEATIRLTLGTLLKRAGYEVTSAENGHDAVELLEQQRFDLLLVDLKMPEMDGMQVVAAARQRQSDLAIIVLTGHGSLETAVEGLHQGVFDYLLKTRGQDIFRMKGVLNVKGEDRRQVFHGVHMMFDAQPERPWGSGPRVNNLVFIGRGLDRAELEAGFESAVAKS